MGTVLPTSRREVFLLMAKSTGIVLTATAIGMGSEWLNDNKINIRMGIAGLFVAFIFDGIERLNEKAAVGLSVIMMITVLSTPINGETPIQRLVDLTTPTPVAPAVIASQAQASQQAARRVR
jgi:hypothetical protein